MNSVLYFYTGTGNSFWAARSLARQIGGADPMPMWQSAADTAGEEAFQHADTVGLFFPVHIWGLPRRVVDFATMKLNDPSKYYFAVALNAGQVAATLLQLRKLLQHKGLVLSAGFEIAMPSNYIPWGGPGPEEKLRSRFAAAEKKVRCIAEAVRGHQSGPIEKGPFWQNIVFSLLYRLSFERVPEMDKAFWTDPKCNGCKVCKAVCPNENIRMDNGKPVWLHRCEQCLACIQWCPRQALQFGKKTPKYPRYHHPEITLKDILAVPRKPGRT